MLLSEEDSPSEESLGGKRVNAVGCVVSSPDSHVEILASHPSEHGSANTF